MPVGQNGEGNTLIHAFRQARYDINSEPESAASILQSVKEQEAQFEQLTRELEAERQSVANQLEKCKLGSETASLSSISSTDDSFQWRQSAQNESHLADESDTDSKISGSQLVDSCLKVLQERGLMDPSGDPMQGLHGTPTGADQSNYSTNLNNTSYYSKGDYEGSERGYRPNGPSESGAHSPHSSHMSVHSYHSQHSNLGPGGGPPPVAPKPKTTQVVVTKTVTTTRTVQQQPGMQQPPVEPRSPYDAGNQHNYVYVSRQPEELAEDYPLMDDGGDEDGYRGRDPRDDYRDLGEPRDDYRSHNPRDDGYRGGDPQDDYRAAGSGYDPPESYGGRGPQYQADPGYYGGGEDPYPGGEEGPDPYGGGGGPVPFGDPDDPYGDDPRYYHQPSYSSGGGYPQQPMLYPDQDPMTEAPPPMRAPLAEPERGSMDHLARTPSMGSDLKAPLANDSPPEDESLSPPPSDSAPPRDKWRSPDLQEVIEYLGHPNSPVVANAAAYLQHLTYGDDDVKNKTRGLGGIPVLVELLGHPIPEIHRSACGALRNISYGRDSADNKAAIKNASGIPALIRLLRSAPDVQTQELVTGVLWNLSSSEPLKKPIIEDGLTVLVAAVVVPEAGFSPDGNSRRDVPASTLFRNTSGCFRNVSSGGVEARTKMRECENLVDSLMHVIHSAVGKNNMDNKSVENCMCVIRNLSYRLPAEVRHPDNELMSTGGRQRPPQKESPGCFGGSKKKDASPGPSKMLYDPNEPPKRELPARGMELLWQPEACKPYLALLSECSNPCTLEAAAGTIQNVTAGEWRWSAYIRASVRKEKGLPVLVELLRMDNDRVVCAVAKALRNLSIDARNKELIGKYAMRDLVYRLPGGASDQSLTLTPDTTVAVLQALQEVITKNMENAKSLRDANGIDRLVTLAKAKDRHQPRVVKAAATVLATMWSFKDLRVLFKKDGWDHSHFLGGARSGGVTPSTSSRSPTGPTHLEETVPLNRLPRSQQPASPTSGFPSSNYSDPYQDSTLDRSGGVVQGRRSERDQPLDGSYYRSPAPEETTMSDFGGGQQASSPTTPTTTNTWAPPTGAVPMFGMAKEPGPQQPHEPVYAQVSKDRKSSQRDRDSDYQHQAPPSTPSAGAGVTLEVEAGGAAPGGQDSWV